MEQAMQRVIEARTSREAPTHEEISKVKVKTGQFSSTTIGKIAHLETIGDGVYIQLDNKDMAPRVAEALRGAGFTAEVRNAGKGLVFAKKM